MLRFNLYTLPSLSRHPVMFFDGSQTEFKPITFDTQEALNAYFAERGEQGKRTATAEILSKTGVKDVDELVTLINEGKTLRESQQTELQKAQADLEALKNEKATAESAIQQEKDEHEKTKKSFTERILKAEVKAEAKKAGFRDESLDDVWMLVVASHREKITEKDDAFVGINKVIEEIKKTREYWLVGSTTIRKKSPGSPQGPQGNKEPEPTPNDEKPKRRRL
ncbi:MAG TPA: hypothetical protein DIW23_07215 [Anaerolineae bacterium]|nr:hypothetical protein [Anaerolineae bacterium]